MSYGCSVRLCRLACCCLHCCGALVRGDRWLTVEWLYTGAVLGGGDIFLILYGTLYLFFFFLFKGCLLFLFFFFVSLVVRPSLPELSSMAVVLSVSGPF